MKRSLVFILANMLIFSSMLAQEQPTHYPFDYHDFPSNMPAIIQVNIDGVEQTSSEIEIGAFNGDITTGAERIGVYGSAGYHRVYLSIYGSNVPYEVTFKLYNHQTGVELDNCEITYLGNPYTFMWSGSTSIGSNKKPVVLNFVTTQPFTKAITGYGTGTGNWYLISSPLADDFTPNEAMTSNTFDLYRFNQSAELEWENWKQTGEHHHFNLESGRGYLYANSMDVTLSFSGEPYNGNGEVTLVKDDDADLAGWNLIGNPFGTAATLNMPFYKMNDDGDGFTAKIEDLTNSIGAMEGVFVQATTNGQKATFTPIISGSKGATTTPMLNINLCRNSTIKGATAIDNAIVRFDGGLCLGKYSFRKGSTKVYFQQDGAEYAVVSSEGMGELPVSFKAEENGNYAIGVNAENVEFNYLHLIDNMTGADIDLLQTPSYSFNATTNDYAQRFKLVFVSGNAHDDHDFAFYSNGNIVITGADSDATLQIVDAIGRIVATHSGRIQCVSTNEMTPGVYVLRLINGESVQVQKMVVR